MAAFVSVLLLAALFALLSPALRRNSPAVALVALVGLGTVLTGCDSSDQSSSQSSSSTTQDSSQSDATLAPTPTPKSRQELKHEFLQTVNEGISGPMIVAAPFKYVGKHVDLHCTVSDVPLQEAVNANCGDDADGYPTNLVIETDSRSLSKGQSIRVIGTVVEPVEGNNADGGDMQFPTVKAEFME